MTNTERQSQDEIERRRVAEYLRDMAGQLAAMAKGAGLDDVARALADARERCDDALS